MKKSAKVLIGIILVLALGAAGTFGYLYFSKDKQPVFIGGDNVATVDGISIITEGTGVRIFNEKELTEKVVFNQAVCNPFFDGKTAYFVEPGFVDKTVKHFMKSGEEFRVGDGFAWTKSKIYSYSTETGKVEELFTSNSEAEIVTVNSGNIYYLDCDSEKIGDLDALRCLSFYKYNIENKEKTKLLDSMAWNIRVGDTIFYQDFPVIKGIWFHKIYAFDLNTEESKRITDDDAYFLKAEDNYVYFLAQKSKLNEDGVLESNDHSLKRIDLSSNKTETLSELDFYKPGDYNLSADCVGDEIYFVDTASEDVFDFPHYSYNLKTGDVTEIAEDDIALCGLVHSFGEISAIEYQRSLNDSDYVTEIYQIKGAGEYTKIYETEGDLSLITLTENGMYYRSASDDESSEFEIKFVPLSIK